VAEVARQAEKWGFTGLLVADSQNLTADIWVELALAGAATSRLRIGPGVTNPLTRHISVTASAAATLHAETRGRAVLGFAQGDSALSQIGYRRLPLRKFEQALTDLQSFLRGEHVQLGGVSSAIHWLPAVGLTKVEVHVATSGPRTIAAAARHAEGIDLTMGAELERLRWGVETARQAGPAGVTLGAYLNVAVDPDRDRARELVRGSTATFARFSAEGAPQTGLSTVTRTGVARVAGGYQESRHGQTAAASARQLDDEFLDRFAVCGPAAEVRRRLAEIADCGIERLIIVPGSLDADPEAMRRSNDSFAADVLAPLSSRPR
jgi:5,10-methylenetetrahydromethanopterin reductase